MRLRMPRIDEADALVDGLMVQWLLAPERCPDTDVLRQAAATLSGLAAVSPAPG